MKKRICLIVLCLLIACASAFAQDVPQLLEPVGAQLNAIAAFVDDLSKMTVLQGAVVPYSEELYFEQDGMVETVHVVVGQTVQAGDPLITLNTDSQEKRLKALQREREQLLQNGRYDDELAQLDLDMMQVELRALQAAMPRDEAAIALKQLQMDQKQLDMELACRLRDLSLAQIDDEIIELEKDLDRNVLCAPFAGRVFFVSDLRHGSYIGAFTPLVYLADDTQLFVETTYLSERSLAGAHRVYARVGGTEYDVTPLPYDEKEYLSKVLAGETLTLRFAVAAPDDNLAAGKFAVVCVETDFVADALLVPTNALYLDGTRYLYVLENGVRVRRDVVIGAMTDWYTQILEGLEEGELVYVQE